MFKFWHLRKFLSASSAWMKSISKGDVWFTSFHTTHCWLKHKYWLEPLFCLPLIEKDHCLHGAIITFEDNINSEERKPRLKSSTRNRLAINFCSTRCSGYLFTSQWFSLSFISIYYQCLELGVLLLSAYIRTYLHIVIKDTQTYKLEFINYYAPKIPMFHSQW